MSLFTLLVRERFPAKLMGIVNGQTHCTQHWTDETDSSLSVTCTHSLGEEYTAQHGHMGVALRSSVNNQAGGRQVL